MGVCHSYPLLDGNWSGRPGDAVFGQPARHLAWSPNTVPKHPCKRMYATPMPSGEFSGFQTASERRLRECVPAVWRLMRNGLQKGNMGVAHHMPRGRVHTQQQGCKGFCTTFKDINENICVYSALGTGTVILTSLTSRQCSLAKPPLRSARPHSNSETAS